MKAFFVKQDEISSIQKNAKITGILFLLVTATHILGTEYIEEILYDPSYLSNAHNFENFWVSALLIMFICCAGIIGIAIFVFPILKKYKLNIALAYLGFRLTESILFILTEIRASSVLILSQKHIEANSVSSANLEVLGAIIQDSRTWSFEMGMLFFCTAALLFYYAFYKTKLIPRFLSLWGLIGAFLAFVSTLLRLYQVEISGLGIILNIPIALNEITLSIWLIIKGYSFSENKSHT